ncbi:hypothetical protein JXB28_04080, partial [Candidatus Woesearchaeota archaeon]|nr:hypothetical protein [Candidatus Woesearchaeota archaeon]
MKLHHEVKKLEEQKKEIIDFMNEIDEQLRARKIRKKEHAKIIEEKYAGKHKEHLITEIDEMIRGLHDNYHEKQKKKLKYAAGATAMLVLLMLGIFSSNQIFSPTGMAVGTRQTTEIINYDSVFEQGTEAALALESITGFRISGILEGTKATVKLRIDGVEYLVGEITPISQDSLITGMATEEEPSPYTIETDKAEYELGETVAITITPEPDDKSLYISYNDEMRKLDEG